MELAIGNLVAQMQGMELNIHQKADAIIEFNKLLEYVEELENQVSENSFIAGVVRSAEEILSEHTGKTGIYLTKGQHYGKDVLEAMEEYAAHKLASEGVICTGCERKINNPKITHLCEHCGCTTDVE